MNGETNDPETMMSKMSRVVPKVFSNKMKIAASKETLRYFNTDRQIVNVHQTDFVDVAAVIVMDRDEDVIDKVDKTRFGIPIFVFTKDSSKISKDVMAKISHIMTIDNPYDHRLYSREIESEAQQYEDSVLPPFFKTLKKYVEQGNHQFDTPGHHGGQYFRKHPAGRAFYDFYGENIFRSDISSSDVKLGDLLIHKGPALAAEKHAARVFNADTAYFVLGGTTTSNNIAIEATVTPGDLVLFDRNNHKSAYNAALVRDGGIPIYLQTSRNADGLIGGIYDKEFSEKSIRNKIAKIDPKRAKEKRPIRLAVIELGTYDGTIYNARQVVDKIGSLCDYILFDSAWVGYEQFIPMMKQCSPLLLHLGPNDPGILVTQSVHKQQAGFSQASQILKKDSHIKGQKRYVDDKRFDNCYMKFASTSPFYPLFASLDVNAQIQGSPAGRRLWHDALLTGIHARKELLNDATMVKPFVPPVVHGKPWQDGDSEKIANDIDYWKVDPDAKWHGFEGYRKNQYFIDPNKLMLTTSGINDRTGQYEKFGLPAALLAEYLREHQIIPEKCNLNSILFLITPAETRTKMDNLISQIVKFEALIKNDVPLKIALPGVYNQYSDRYRGYTMKQLCNEMHSFYKDNDAKKYQKELFLAKYFPEQTMTPHQADIQLRRNNAELVPLKDIVGRTALEGALPYPPGIFCIAPGEKWTPIAQRYFQIFEAGINKFPGFAPEINGVYFKNQNGKVRAYGYVYKKNK